ncbi:MAG TPA: hypothetical protein VK689_14300 [Armatimonadota bacterium]|nr:hypothetical protein [Armatimonadota bacterium]
MKNRGYQLVTPDLWFPGNDLDDDARVRILSYLTGTIREISPVPQEVMFDVIWVQYCGDPYPGIGLYSRTLAATNEELLQLSFELEKRLDAHITKTGVVRLLELSAAETLSWEDVLRPFGKKARGE